MKITVYDKKPGIGFMQWCLKISWAFGCWYQKLFGAVDEYFGAENWEELQAWILSRKEPITSLQFWGHGSAGAVWLAQKKITWDQWLTLKKVLTPDTILWFRTCSTFQGQHGFDYSKHIADGLGCTVAGHTRIIGPLQGGLHTRKPNTEPSWSVKEYEFPPALIIPPELRYGNNTVTCLATKVPKGW